jgi:signal transduction histidine kinase
MRLLNPEGPLTARGGTITAWLAMLVLAGVLPLAWVGYRAANAWQSSAAQLLKQRQQQIAGSLAINLVRDMRAVQATVIDRREWTTVELTSPERLAQVLAPVFRRYAYPEVFFAARLPLEPNFLARASRMPSWAAAPAGEAAGMRWFRNPEVAELLRTHIRSDAGRGRDYSIFPLNIGGTQYQVVIRFLRGAAGADSPTAVVGFLVNMDWARQFYFVPLLQSVVAGTDVPVESQIPDPKGVEFALLDQQGKTVGGRREIAKDREPYVRRLNVYFFDPAMANTEAVHDLEKWMWTMQVAIGGDSTIAIATSGARRTMLVLAASALIVGLGLVIIVRATRAAAALASMRSEFVSTVTHELKTPMSVIQSVGETMLRGRVSSPEQQREYAQLLVQETYRLRRLIDNLLAYARVTEVADVYTFEPLQPEEVVEEAVQGFRKLLRDRNIEVNVSVPRPLPKVRADRNSLVFALDNLLDNAMRHADTAEIGIEIRQNENAVEFVATDRGRGIAENELRRVQQPFIRGDASRGSGLGLAIVHRIAAAHRGTFRLESRVDEGTTATLAIPVEAA